MKATIIILAAVLSLQVNTLTAGNTFDPLTPSNAINTSNFAILVPTTPAEATFEDEATLKDFAGLALVTPTEAKFEDNVDSNNAGMLINLAPVTPIEADFNDEIYQTVDFISLAPVTPTEADFSDT